VLIVLVFVGCAYRPAYSLSVLESTWQEAFARLLLQYEERDGQFFFLLHDFLQDGTPELLVMGDYLDEIYDAAYTFSGGVVVPLKFGDGVYIAGYALCARNGITAAPYDEAGLICFLRGASSAFGWSIRYTWIVLNDYELVVYVQGAIISEAERIRWYVNDRLVSEDEFNHIFGTEYRDSLSPMRITKERIDEMR